MSSVLSPTRLVTTQSRNLNHGRDLMGKLWTLASHSWSNTTRAWVGLIGWTRTWTGTALPSVKRNVPGPSLHIAWIVALNKPGICTGSRRKLWARPTISSPSAARLKERSLPVVLDSVRSPGLTASQHSFPEQISFYRLDHLVQPSPTQVKMNVLAAWKTKHRRCKVGIPASSCSTQSELLFRLDILIGHQTSCHLRTIFVPLASKMTNGQYI